MCFDSQADAFSYTPHCTSQLIAVPSELAVQ